jgi:hypothetical protein
VVPKHHQKNKSIDASCTPHLNNSLSFYHQKKQQEL